jgi:hypothetical protein
MDGSGKAQLLAYTAAAVVLVAGGFYLLRGEGGEGAKGGGGVSLDGASGPRQGGAAAPDGDRGTSGARPLYVHVAGEVCRTGLYVLRPGSRVAAAVRKAGGLRRKADFTAFNLATGRPGCAAGCRPAEGAGGRPPRPTRSKRRRHGPVAKDQTSRTLLSEAQQDCRAGPEKPRHAPEEDGGWRSLNRRPRSRGDGS